MKALIQKIANLGVESFRFQVATEALMLCCQALSYKGTACGLASRLRASVAIGVLGLQARCAAESVFAIPKCIILGLWDALSPTFARRQPQPYHALKYGQLPASDGQLV